jgi:hypothetical protein
VPVALDGSLMGLVSRASLVRALAMTAEIGGMCGMADGQRGSDGVTNESEFDKVSVIL